ncbi:MAG TPA: LuxR C-terminal-related transcriptional regulator [Propionicimonas sp.]|nr:LuxR C-terminal-related transcriptional regulator [Propionicimonas sp.]
MTASRPSSSAGTPDAAPDPANLVATVRTLWESAQWLRCLELLNDAAERGPLPEELVELHGQLAFLVGREDESLTLNFDAFRRFEAAGNFRAAARVAFWSAFLLFNRGELAQGAAWRARSWKLVNDHHLGGAEEAQLLGMDGHQAWLEHRPEVALQVTERALDMARQAGHRDGIALGQLTKGRVELELGHRDDAMACFDEAMASVSAGETSPVVAGTLYCAVIDICMRARDLRRATEWTSALTVWCRKRPDLVPYRGPCLVHRAQLSVLHGEWTDALRQASEAAAILPPRQVGEAHYLLGEIHRLTGAFQQAERDFRQANSSGYQPEPGLARLRISEGRADAAVTTLTRLVDDRRRVEDTAELLSALVNAHLALGDLAAARGAAQQLGGIAGDLDSPLLSGYAAQATGAVLCAEGSPTAALTALRRAWQTWRDLDLPQLAAQARTLVGRCLLAVGDEDAARMEFDAAREVFTRLGAAPDLAELDAILAASTPLPDGLTAREVQVIRLVAAGLSNRAVAEDLFLSEKTVARHLSNVYGKLGLTSRAAATAYAYDHGIVARRGD